MKQVIHDWGHTFRGGLSGNRVLAVLNLFAITSWKLWLYQLLTPVDLPNRVSYR